MVDYQSTPNTYLRKSSYESNKSSNNSAYQVTGYTDAFSAADRRCRGTCKLYNLCTCGSR